MKTIYITGLHRAGTHTAAQYHAKLNGMLYVDEGEIRWDDLECALALPNKKIRRLDDNGKPTWYWIKDRPELKSGIVVQCPGIAHECEALSQAGKVFWVTRNHLDIVTSMRNGAIETMAWHLMKGFRQKWPTDPIWQLIKYDGGEDKYNNFVGYYTILVKVKDYFFDKHLSKFSEKIKTEDQSYFKPNETVTKIHPLNNRELDHFKKYEMMWEVAWRQLTCS